MGDRIDAADAHMTRPSQCSNCGAALGGAFCAQCGQKVTPLNPSLREFLHDFFHELAHFDGKIIQSARFLLTRPGYLLREYFEGRRAGYVSPIRLYLVFSILYFAAVAFAPLSGPRIACTSCPPEIKEFAEQQMREAFVEWTPRAMFLLVPVFAGLIALAARRSGRNYPQHLYFALHVHAAWFFAGTVGALANAGAVPYLTAFLGGAAAVYSAWYFGLAFRFAYDMRL